MLLFIVKDMSDRDGDPAFKALWSKLLHYCNSNQLIFQEDMAGSI